MQLLCKTAVGGQALQSPNYYDILVVKEAEVSTSESNSELQKEIIVRFFVISVKEDRKFERQNCVEIEWHLFRVTTLSGQNCIPNATSSASS